MKLTRKVYADDKEKRRDFWRGFWLWWAGNIVLGILTTALTFIVAALPATQQDETGVFASLVGLAWSALPFVVNVGVIILLALTRSQMALGMLAAFAASFAVVLVLGVILAVVCFVMIAASGSGVSG